MEIEMKKITAIAVSAALALSVGVSAPTVAAKGASEEVEACKAGAIPGDFETLGDCIGTVRGGLPKFCASDASQFLWDIFGFRNQGDCVSFIRSLQN
jgi:hypothetical protein